MNSSKPSPASPASESATSKYPSPPHKGQMPEEVAPKVSTSPVMRRMRRKHPELSHLEDEELVNAVADSLIQRLRALEDILAEAL